MTLTRMSDGVFQLAQADTAAPAQGTAADPHASAPGAPAGETHAGTVADGQAGHRAEFPPFAPQYFLAQVLWLAIAFGAMYYILSRYALPRIGGILAERQGRIDADLGEAHRLKAESDAAIAAYEKALSDARNDAQKKASGAREAAARESDAKRKALEAALSERIAAAEAQIAQTKTAALGNVRGIASDAATTIVQHLTGILPAPAEVEQAVDAALTQRQPT